MKKPNEIQPRAIIFDAFANAEYTPVQPPETVKLIDNFRILVPQLRDFDLHSARKEHECVRGCEIHIGESYFREAYVWSGIKMCVSCMAMIIYYQHSWEPGD